ncbi:MAG: DUF1398 domain-containing protein [Flexibacteraceae bacterium]
MFTLDQIKAAHSKVKSGADFLAYIQELKALGVLHYETFVAEGNTNYYGANAYNIIGDAKYPALSVAETTDGEQFKSALKAHQQGKTDYPTFCSDCAEAGILKWQVNLEAMTCTYIDTAGFEILVEEIPS